MHARAFVCIHVCMPAYVQMSHQFAQSSHCPTTPHRYPGDAMLNRVYLESCQWKSFKHLTISDTLDRLRGCLYAAKPATSKGTSGPAVFPGVVKKEVLPPLKQNCLFCDNVVSVPTQEMKDANNHLPRI